MRMQMNIGVRGVEVCCIHLLNWQNVIVSWANFGLCNSEIQANEYVEGFCFHSQIWTLRVFIGRFSSVP